MRVMEVCWLWQWCVIGQQLLLLGFSVCVRGCGANLMSPVVVMYFYLDEGNNCWTRKWADPRPTRISICLFGQWDYFSWVIKHGMSGKPLSYSPITSKAGPTSYSLVARPLQLASWPVFFGYGTEEIWPRKSTLPRYPLWLMSHVHPSLSMFHRYVKSSEGIYLLGISREIISKKIGLQLLKAKNIA